MDNTLSWTLTGLLVVGVLFTVTVAVLAVGLESRETSCLQNGGLLVRTTDGWQCARVELLVPKGL